MSTNKKGVLILNLGTPEQPTPKAVKAYLLAFLSDQRVIDYPKWLWQLILRGIILTVRPPKVAKAYQSIWTEQGSPLRVISFQQMEQLQTLLGDDYLVDVAMTYGTPTIDDAFARFEQAGVDDITLLPLYPQYSATTTAAAFDAVANSLKKIKRIPNLRFIKQYCHHAKYIEVLGNSIKTFWQAQGAQHFLMFSFHGIPKRYVEEGDPYQQACEQTAQDVAEYLNLSSDQWMICYQSRVGREEWLQPYTDKTLESLPKQGIKDIDVVCPAFSVDCLETLEEVAVENKQIFIDAGGRHYRYIPALNADEEHMQFIAGLVNHAN